MTARGRVGWSPSAPHTTLLGDGLRMAVPAFVAEPPAVACSVVVQLCSVVQLWGTSVVGFISMPRGRSVAATHADFSARGTAATITDGQPETARRGLCPA